MALIHIENKEEFNKEVLNSGKPALVDFWADWCGPCKMLTPIIEEIGTEIDYGVIAKVDVDKLTDLAETYGIQNIPTIIFFKEGKEVNRLIGVRAKADIVKALEAIK